ncbi:MAG TPA: sigma-70 family RNA polymerase sigma factor [Longimicrobium sp.]|jgi:RNA polymerase sigma-70 factor (ECF subfamily)
MLPAPAAHPVRAFTPTPDVADAVSEAFREQWGQIVATLIRITGDWDLAEECAQDAFARAVERWPADGVPRRPGAWLTTTARNRAIDRRRRDALGKDKLQQAIRLWHLDEPASPHDEWEPHAIPDDRLRLIFACCHPALPSDTGVALALRAVAGLSTSAIARVFRVSEMTMSKRLVRAKSKIRKAPIPFRVPPAHLLAERAEAVRKVLRLMFDEGHFAGDLRREAIRLTRMLVELMPHDAEARRLLARMLLHEKKQPHTEAAEGQGKARRTSVPFSSPPRSPCEIR